MTSLPRISVNNPVPINLLMMAILAGGAYSGFTLVREMFPESRPNRVLISTAYPGATPSEIEKGITLRIEEEIKGVDGIEKITSNINEGISAIFVELRSGFDDVDQAVTDIKAAVDAIPADEFPEEAKETRVTKFDPQWPVISVAVFGDFDDRTLKRLGERLKSDLLALPNITNVVVTGSRDYELSVEVRPSKLVEYSLSLVDVARAIDQSNLDLPGGQLRTERSNVAVRTLGETDEVAGLLDIVIRNDFDGRVVRLRDVATVLDTFVDVDISGRFNAKPAVNVTVYKTADQDAIEIAGLVRATVAGRMGQPLDHSWMDRFVAELRGGGSVALAYALAQANPFPTGVRLEVHTDLSRFIEQRLDLLKRNGFWGLVLVTLSLLVFLHWRVALWVMMGLVLAIAGSLLAMKLLGQTLNLITMFGMIIVLGLLVDDAIIVSEHVYSKMEQGVEPKLAAIEGTEAVMWPVACAIVTTICAFVPLMFIEGQIGDWIGVLPVIVCVALSVSLIESLTILPSHLAHGLRPLEKVESEQREGRGGAILGLIIRMRKAQTRLIRGSLRSRYESLLRLAISYRYVTIAVLISCVIVARGMVVAGHVSYTLLQDMDSETMVAKVRMDIGSPIHATQKAIEEIERAAMALPELRTLYTLMGTHVSDDGVVAAPQSHLAQLFIELAPAEERNRTSEAIAQVLREQTNDIPGIHSLQFDSLQGGPAGSPIHLEISGVDVDALTAIAQDIKAQLATFDGVSDIVDDFDAGRREVRIELFDSASALGLTTELLATQVRAAFHGHEARKVQRGREDVAIVVRYPLEHRRSVYDIESMRIATPTGAMVPFTEVARLTEGTGYASIKRTNQRRTVTVTADVNSDVTNADSVMAIVARGFSDVRRRHPGVRFEFGGQKLETRKSFGSLKTDFLAACLMIYAILAALFRSYIQPLIVMAVIPFGLIGAVAGHWLMGYPLTIVSLIGLVALSGIVVNDSLILVTFINRRVESGIPILQAVVQGGLGRMRPILLTSATTVLGIAPLLAEQSFQAKFLIPMGISISAGLIFATVLTLIAVPSIYLIVDDVKVLATKMFSPVIGSSVRIPTPDSDA